METICSANEAGGALPWLLAVLGGWGGWLVAVSLGGELRGERGSLLLLITGLSCFVLGLRLRKVRHALWPLRVVFGVLLAAAVNGAVFGVLAFGPQAVAIGGIFGALCSLAFVVPIVVLFWMTRTARARPGSLVDNPTRRAPWRTLIAMGALLTAHITHGAAPFALLCVSAPILAVLMYLDMETQAVLRSLRLRMPSLRALPALDGAASIDLGLGDALHAKIEESAGPFRSAPVTTFVLRGEMRPAHRLVARIVALDAVALFAVAAEVLRLMR